MDCILSVCGEQQQRFTGVLSISFRSSSGCVKILPKHENMILISEESKFIIVHSDGESIISIASGFVEVKDNICMLLSSSIIREDSSDMYEQDVKFIESFKPEKDDFIGCFVLSEELARAAFHQ